jgi:hypothetical protein
MEQCLSWQAQQRIGEVWLAAYQDDVLKKLRILRESDGVQPGDKLSGLIKGPLSARQYLLELNTGETVVVEAGTQRLYEGLRCQVHITRAAIAEPGLVKRAQGIVVAPLTRNQPDPPAIQSIRLPHDTRWVASLPQAEDVIADALQGTYPLPGGSLSFERTRAGLVVDVDGYGSAEALNTHAAQALTFLLPLWDISGNVIVDFLQSTSKTQRTDLGHRLDQGLNATHALWQRNGPNGYGLVQLVAPKRHPSLLDQLFGTNRATPSLYTQALTLVNAAQKSQGMGARTLWASPSVIRLLEENTGWIASLSKKLGVPVLLCAQNDPNAGAYVQVEHPAAL